MKKSKQIFCILFFLLAAFWTCSFVINKHLGITSYYTVLNKEYSKKPATGISLKNGNYLYIDSDKRYITIKSYNKKTKTSKTLNAIECEFVGIAPGVFPLSQNNFLIVLKRSIDGNKTDLPQMYVYLYNYDKNSINKLDILPKDLAFRNVYANGNILTGVASENQVGCPSAKEIINYDYVNDKIVSKTRFENANFCAFLNLKNGHFALYDYERGKGRIRKAIRGVYDYKKNELIKPGLQDSLLMFFWNKK